MFSVALSVRILQECIPLLHLLAATYRLFSANKWPYTSKQVLQVSFQTLDHTKHALNGLKQYLTDKPETDCRIV